MRAISTMMGCWFLKNPWANSTVTRKAPALTKMVTAGAPNHHSRCSSKNTYIAHFWRGNINEAHTDAHIGDVQFAMFWTNGND